VRNHSYHQFYPVLANIRINRIRINQGLLYFTSYLKLDLLKIMTVMSS